MNGQGQNAINWMKFSNEIRNRENPLSNHTEDHIKDRDDIDQVETSRQKRKGRQSKTQIRFILSSGNTSFKQQQQINQVEQPPHQESFQTPQKAKTRAARRAEDDLSDDAVNEPIAVSKRVRRSNYWVVRDTQHMNRSRRLKQLETVRRLSFDDEDMN
jgi:hypothetical protein